MTLRVRITHTEQRSPFAMYVSSREASAVEGDLRPDVFEAQIIPGRSAEVYLHHGKTLLINEREATEEERGAAIWDSADAAQEWIAQFFSYAHLPQPLADISRPFAEMAQRMLQTLPRNPERTVALRKLMESKDAAVRAFIGRSPMHPPTVTG